MDYANGQYDERPWNRDYQTRPWNSHGPGIYSPPSASWEEQVIRQATVVLTLPREDVQTLVRPPLPSIMAPGANPHHADALTVERVIGESTRQYADRQAFFSGGPAGYMGAPRNEWGAPY